MELLSIKYGISELIDSIGRSFGNVYKVINYKTLWLPCFEYHSEKKDTGYTRLLARKIGAGACQDCAPYPDVG